MKKKITALKPLNQIVKSKLKKISKEKEDEIIEKRYKEIEENKYIIPEDFFIGF